jgi:hypothetical protein
MSTAAPPPLRLEEAVPLVSALLATRAEANGIRVLVVKGPVAALQGLRPAKPSGDVDVLVEPDRHAALVEVLRQDGWVPRPPLKRALLMAEHSVTMRHEMWPCELDLHGYWPGLLAGPAPAFEALWSGRTAAVLADTTVPVCGIAHHAGVLALHSIRNGPGRDVDPDWHPLVSAASNFSIGEKLELADMAAAAGAIQTLAPFLRAIGAPEVPGAPIARRDLQAWHLFSSTTGMPSVAWVHALLHTKMWAWPRVIWSSVALNPTELRRVEHGVDDGAFGLWRARLRRLARGIHRIPLAIRAYRTAHDDVRRICDTGS